MFDSRLYKDIPKLAEKFRKYHHKFVELSARADLNVKAMPYHVEVEVKAMLSDVDRLSYIVALDEQIMKKTARLEKIITNTNELVLYKNELSKEIKEMEKTKNKAS